VMWKHTPLSSLHMHCTPHACFWPSEICGTYTEVQKTVCHALLAARQLVGGEGSSGAVYICAGLSFFFDK
jgi:hypothetical protein